MRKSYNYSATVRYELHKNSERYSISYHYTPTNYIGTPADELFNELPYTEDFSEFIGAIKSAESGVYELRVAASLYAPDQPDYVPHVTTDIIIKVKGVESTYTISFDGENFGWPSAYETDWLERYGTTPFPDYAGWYQGYWLIDTETGSIIHETQDLTRPWFNNA